MQQDNTSLRIENISLMFGGLKALQNVTIEVSGKGIYSVIGPNGAGKTCILNCINGFYRPASGKIIFDNTDITRMPSHKIAKLGISRAFQNLALYGGMDVLDNIMAGRYMLQKYGAVLAAVYFGRAKKEEIEHRKVVEDIIEFLKLQSVRHAIVGTLPYGMRKRVELGRALALEPKLLLLDEPMAGMNTEEKEEIARYILDIRGLRKIPVILVEHDMGVVMDISDRVTVLNFGNKIAEGTPDEVAVNPAVVKAYLGDEA